MVSSRPADDSLTPLEEYLQKRNNKHDLVKQFMWNVFNIVSYLLAEKPLSTECSYHDVPFWIA